MRAPALAMTVGFVAGLLLSACASDPLANKPPAWATRSARTIDGGQIVYLGRGEDADDAPARFKAEYAAWADLANECSFVPTGVAIDDTYREVRPGAFAYYVKLIVSPHDCEAARAAVAPAEIRSRANAKIAAQLRRYQALYYDRPGIPAPADGAEPVGDIVALLYPAGDVYEPIAVRDTTSFVLVQQQIFREKQRVLLAPSAAYAAGSRAATELIARVERLTKQLNEFARRNPGAAAPVPWSYVQNLPEVHESGLPHLSLRFAPTDGGGVLVRSPRGKH